MVGNRFISLPYGVFIAYIIILNFYLLFFSLYTFLLFNRKLFFHPKTFLCVFLLLTDNKVLAFRIFFFSSLDFFNLPSLFAIHSTPIVNIVCCIKWTLKNSIIFPSIPFLEIYRSILLCLFN